MTTEANLTPGIPTSFFVGDSLDWQSRMIDVHLVVELPFFLMMEPAMVNIAHGLATHLLLVSEGETEDFVGRYEDSRRTCGYQGSDPDAFESRQDVKDLGLPFIRRRQRTTVYFKARVHEGILRDAHDMSNGSQRRLVGDYLSTLCEAHLPVLNELIRRYRLSTYDYFAYEVSAWDVPIWHVRGGPTGSVSVVLFHYAALATRPQLYRNIFKPNKTDAERQEHHSLTLTDGEALESFDPSIGVPGELDLLDARNLMERGDYAGAIRRATTAIEALVEHVLRLELLKSHDSITVERKLAANQNDYPGRYRQWKKLSGVAMDEGMEKSFERTRKLRHEIVHSGRRITFDERHVAQKCVDTGRWFFNRIEQQPKRSELREKNNTVRSLARPTLAFRFPVEETPDGFIVKPLRDEIES
jgi:hypothetical protein